MPQLLDPNFKRSVVLLVHHDEEGTFGLVVNRPSDIPVEQLCSNLDIHWAGDTHEVLRWGGPVQPNTGWVLWDGADLGSVEGTTSLGPDLAMAGSLDALQRVAASPPRLLRMMLGYAGWGPHQLEDELADGAWLVAPACADVVFDVPADDMWEHVVRSLGIDPSTLVPTPGVH